MIFKENAAIEEIISIQKVMKMKELSGEDLKLLQVKIDGLIKSQSGNFQWNQIANMLLKADKVGQRNGILQHFWKMQLGPQKPKKRKNKNKSSMKITETNKGDGSAITSGPSSGSESEK